MGSTISSTIESSILFPSPICSYTKDLKDLIWVDENHPVVGPPRNPSMSDSNFSFFPALIIKRPNPVDCTILYWHGNSCDLGQIYEELEEMSESIDCNVCGIEFPGYGLRNDLFPSSELLNQWSYSIFNFLIWSGVPSKSIFLLGRSIGTGPACFLASKLSKGENIPGGLILHSPFKSLRDLSQDYAGRLGPIFISDYWNNANEIASIPPEIPLLVIHGMNDEIIPIYHGIYLHQSSKSVKKCSSFPEDCPHNEYSVTDHLSIPIVSFFQEIGYSTGKGNLSIMTDAYQTPVRLPTIKEAESDDSSTINLIRKHLSRRYSISFFANLIDSPSKALKNKDAILSLFSKENLEETIPEIVAEARKSALKNIRSDS